MAKETIISRQASESEHIGRVYTTVKGFDFKVVSVEQQQVFIEYDDGSSKVITRKIATVKFVESGYITTVHTKNLPPLSSDGKMRVKLSSPFDKRDDGTFIGMSSNKKPLSTDTDLYKKWDKLMKHAKSNDLPVDEDLKEYAKFLQQARNIFNYEEWLRDEDNYRLVVHKGANKVAFNTILFVSEETWQNEYRKQSGGQTPKPVFAYVDLGRYGIYDKEGYPVILGFKCDSIDDCVQRTALWQPSITNCLQGVMETTGAGVENPLEGWRFVDLSLFDITDINFNSNRDKYKLIQDFQKKKQENQKE